MKQELVRLGVAFDLTTMNRPSVDQVKAVISALYNDSDQSGKEKASQWLQELQRSVCTATFILFCWFTRSDANGCNVEIQSSFQTEFFKNLPP